MWNFKKCPRCKGDTFIDKCEGVWYEQCLQCGYERALENMVVEKEKAARKQEVLKSR